MLSPCDLGSLVWPIFRAVSFEFKVTSNQKLTIFCAMHEHIIQLRFPDFRISHLIQNLGEGIKLVQYLFPENNYLLFIYVVIERKLIVVYN